MADGIQKAGTGDRVIALIGDSSFFHTTLPAICNAAVNQSNVLIIVLDNKSTLTSGHQPNPGVGRNARGKAAATLDIERVAKACGVESVFAIDLDDPEVRIKKVIQESLIHPQLRMLIVRIVSDP